MVKSLWLVGCILTTWTVVAVSSQAPAPAPAADVDCSSLIYNMADCLSFLSDGSNDTKPDDSCCSGFKSVLDIDADCICEGLKSSASLGLELNMTQAVTLPSACGISAPSLSSCLVSLAPGPPPGAAPVSPPSKNAPAPKTKSPPPKAATITSAAAPVSLVSAPVPEPSPAKSRAYTISISLSVLFAVVAASVFFLV